jgi:hypothetical protein
MCGYGLNNKIIKEDIKQVLDLHKFSKMSGKRKRLYNFI